MFALICRAKESLSVELDPTLDWRVDRAVDGGAELFDTAESVRLKRRCCDANLLWRSPR